MFKSANRKLRHSCHLTSTAAILKLSLILNLSLILGSQFLNVHIHP